MEADTAAAKSVVATEVAVAAVIATMALTAEAQATEAVDNQDTATVEEEARTAEAMALRRLRPTVAAHSLLLLRLPQLLLNLPPQQ
jgi:hypothetical protein